MDTAEEPNASALGNETTIRTPAYASFDSNAEKLLHVVKFQFRGIQHFVDDLTTNVTPEVDRLCAESAGLGNPQGKDLKDQEPDIDENYSARAITQTSQRSKEIANELSEIVVKPVQEFVDGLLTVYQWIPVLLVTIVEAYLKDVKIFEATVNPAVMESSKQSVAYARVLRARSIEELTEEMQSRWAQNFVDDGGPARWIEKLTRMGARGYAPQAAVDMETLWGIRHVIVHAAGIATADFVHRHPGYGAKVGKNILIRTVQFLEWAKVVHHFVDVTDQYFVNRYGTGTVLTN